jgi:hypothetical protein
LQDVNRVVADWAKGCLRRKPGRSIEQSDTDATMGTIIQFPDGIRALRDPRASGQIEDATILILPSVRVERHPDPSDDGPNTTDSPPRSRRRRGSR